MRRYNLGLEKKGSGAIFKMACANKNICSEELRYLGGLFDGEGTISIIDKRGQLHGRIAIGMKEEELLKWVRELFNCGIIYKNNKGLWLWSVNTTEDLKIIIPQLSKFCKIKRERMELLLQYLINHNRTNRYQPTPIRLPKEKRGLNMEAKAILLE